MSVMLDNTSAPLFEIARTVFQAGYQRLIDDILHIGLSLEDELNDRVGQLHLSLEQLKRARRMMAIDCSTSELLHVVPIRFLTVLIDHPGQDPMSEEPADVACNLETQSFLWDLGMPFPVTISYTEDSAL
ncbi:hypothetical protein N7537_005837 [Penicillium hordei]|uniref:Uncharacterized protein n=1 Tax=Penicillium hordei TaxID=40994 RepID=A0AAD6E6X2_9EURO|nr:uncharacterized protein N7537_005837 [Penicillium hordei]KAJ5602881.1 hypothetical protein N7537_005837 [Penicillium hordei]